jgi:ABC-type polysaccharide/polyol phosphate transport system ATPase subunit/SAM-dependent methyltransferase
MIRVEQVSKRFRLYRQPADRLKEILLRRSYHSVHEALTDISFQVEDGQTLGIIGQNGAGKSTLLKILTGVLLPDSGQVQVSGRVTGLLELGTGFNMEMSGLHNIRANAMLLGMTTGQIAARREAIIEFAELGAFIHEPLKTYSSGMVMRLAFAIAIHADPSCFVVDEALSVGDAYFQQKCMRAIQAFRARGGSILFVSHDMSAVKTLCDRAILLEGGRILDQGAPKDVVDHYHARLLHRTHQGDVPVVINRPGTETAGPDVASSATPEATASGAEPSAKAPLVGTGEVNLLALELRNAHGERVEHVVSEEPLTILARLRAERDLDQPHYGIGIRNRFGHSVFETNTYCMDRTPPPVAAGETIQIEWRLKANLIKGDYSITVGVGNRPYGTGSFDEILFFAHDLAMLHVEADPDAIRYDGYFNMHPEVRVDSGGRTISRDAEPRTSDSVRAAYTSHYYLADCGGYETYREHGGKHLDPRLDCMARLARFHAGAGEGALKILDLGCGRGELARHFAALGHSVDAIDYSPEALRLAEACFAGEPELRRRVVLQCASVTDPGVYRTQYDIVLASDLIEHLAPDELDRLYGLIRTHLAPDGCFVVHTFPNLWYYSYDHPRRRRLAIERGETPPPVDPRSDYERLMHINEQSPARMRRQLRAAFEEVLLWAGDHEEPAGSLARPFGTRGWREARSLFAIAARQPIDPARVIAALDGGDV